ncbi:MAG: hypothetical protein ACK4RK_06805 [Gemmataceae bacterium]
MQARQAKPRNATTSRRPWLAWLGLGWCLAAGCAAGPHPLDPFPAPGPAFVPARTCPSYRPACPDVLEWTVDEHPSLQGKEAIGADGCIDLGPLGRQRVEGLTLSEIADKIADLAAIAPRSVRMRVVEYHSQKIYLFGQVTGFQRVVSYQGEETVLELLQRVGGITEEAAPDDVYVVRAHVIAGKPPEVFHIKLRDIVLKEKQQTNIHLRPADQVYVGETEESFKSRCLPPCMRPLHKLCCQVFHSWFGPPLPKRGPAMNRPLLCQEDDSKGWFGKSRSKTPESTPTPPPPPGENFALAQ